MRFRKTSKSLRKNVNRCKPLKKYFHVSLKATKLFEPTRSQVNWYFEGSKLASQRLCDSCTEYRRFCHQTLTFMAFVSLSLFFWGINLKLQCEATFGYICSILILIVVAFLHKKLPSIYNKWFFLPCIGNVREKLYLRNFPETTNYISLPHIQYRKRTFVLSVPNMRFFSDHRSSND